VPAKIVLRLTEAEVNLIDRQSGRLIWNVKRSATWEDTLEDEIVDQLKKDRERSALNQ
jgi:hypothetical protein